MNMAWMIVCRAVQITIISSVLVVFASCFISADEKSPVPKSSFAEIVQAHTRASLQAVAGYVKENPQAADVAQATQWLFATAASSGMENEVLSLAEEYLQRPRDKQPLRAEALRVVGVGRAKAGKLADAIAILNERLQDVDVRKPDEALDYGVLLAEYAQLQGDSAAVREIYDALAGRLFLNPFVRGFCEHRQSHLELAKQPAPRIGAIDLEGHPIDLGGLAGRVVLVDFWATNCEPCLRQFPEMKKLYGEYHDKGLEIVGISLDDEASTVSAFQTEFKLPWRLALSSTDRDETRRRYRADKVPTMYLVDQKGNIAFVDLHDDRIRTAVENLLGIGK
jgi:thiol-disulfide isomerase/thioredoxin